MDRQVDVVVVGANVAGSSTAWELARRGMGVTLVERQRGPEVGSRSCGDGIERFQFERLGIPVPQGDFILREVGVAYLVSPDRQHRLRGEAAGIATDRFALNQHLLARAVEAGAELVDHTEVARPVVEGGRVAGVCCRPRDESHEHFKLRAPVTVDATGWRALLRRVVPADWPIAERVPRDEMALGYREERRRSEPVEELLVEATFDFELAPRGLYWVADRTPELVNVGVGMQWAPGIPSPRRLVRDRVVPLYPGLEGTRLLRSGGGIIPNRRPIDCPVAPGLVAVGDAACQVQPLSGSGIGASMYASRLAAEAIQLALEATRQPGMDELFGYPRGYHSTYGVDQAANQVLRMSLQRLTNDQLNRLIGSKLVSEEELVAAARTGRLQLTFGAKLKAAAKLLGEPRLARALSRTHSDMERVRELYRQYPEEPGGLPAWRSRVSRAFATMGTR